MKTNKLILTTIILTFSLLSFSQESIMFDRMHNIDGYGSGAHGLRQTPDSGFIACGAVGLTFYDDAYLLYKTDKYGEMQWYNYFGIKHSTLMKIDLLEDEGFVGAGYNNNNEDWDGHSIIIRYNDQGDTIWHHVYNPEGIEGFEYETKFFTVLSTTDNNIIAGGYIGTNGYTNPYIVKTDLNGDTLWTWHSNYINNTFWVESIAETPDGDYVAVGKATYEWELGKEYAPERGVIIKLGQNGNLIFFKEYFDIEYSNFQDLAISSTGDIYVSGAFYEHPPEYPDDSYNGLIVKYDEYGDVVYSIPIEYGNTLGVKNICIMNEYKICVTAMFDTPLGFDNWYYDVLLQSYTTDGELLWQKAIGGQYNTNWPNDLILTNDGGIAFCGSNALDGYINSWIVKTDSLGNGNYNPGWENSVAQQQFALDVLLYPNPASDFVSIETSDNSTTFDLEIYTITGQKVFEKTNNIGLSQINVSGFSQGIYIVNIKSENKVYTGKLSVKH